MCGRFHLLKDDKTHALAKELGFNVEQCRFAPDFAPAAKISFLRLADGVRGVATGFWWLALDEATLKPNYTLSSFNLRSDKRHKKGAMIYDPYRQSRCLIPASAFIEGAGDRQTYHKIAFDDEAIAFGGVYKEYLSRETGECVFAVSIITLPPIPEWAAIHPKSTPLMMPWTDKDLVEQWLDPTADIARFEGLMSPKMTKPQTLTPIGKPSQWNPTGPSFTLYPGQVPHFESVQMQNTLL
jgi:putative SOS response-associated peptidase YedK